MARKRKLILTSFILLLSVFLLMGCAQEVQISNGSIVTRSVTVMDRAMATPSGRTEFWYESYPYLTVKFEDGNELCVWNMRDVDIPDDIKPGDTVEITYTDDGTYTILVSVVKPVP